LLAWLRNQGYGVVLSGGAQATCHLDVAAITHGTGPEVVDLVGRMSLAELAAVLGRAALYVGPDTGVSHIAAATGTPMVVLFGPSNPVSWGPWPASWRRQESPWTLRGSRQVGNVFLLQGPGPCVPCQQEGCERHQQSRSDCLSLLSGQTVIDAAARMLALNEATSHIAAGEHRAAEEHFDRQYERSTECAAG
jgi:heptosyltransferase III